MNMIAENLKEGESERVSLMSPRADMEAIGRTVCGMLNQKGGKVLWGVDSKGHPVGVADAAEKAQALNDLLMRNLVQRPFLSVSVEEYKGKQFVLIGFPEGADKPYSFLRQTWVRLGRQTLRASPEESSRMVEDSVARESRWGRDTLPGFGLSDCDGSEMEDARKEIAAVGRFGIEVPQENDELLRRLYLLNSGRFTNAAMVLFARDPLKWSPNLALRIVAFGGDKQSKALHEQTLKGPAVHVLRQAVSVIQQQTGFTSRFHPGKIERQDRPAYAVYALREGLVNAMAHRDYESVGGQLTVEIFPEHLVIRNPGRLPDGWSGKDVVKKEESRPTNPDIANVFHLRDLMERLGLGGRKLDEACRALKAKPPVWKADQGVVSLTIYRAPQTESLAQVLPRQKDFLKSLAPNAEIKADDYATATEVSLRQARRDLGDLCDLGLLERFGKGPSTVYRLVEGGGHE